VLLLELIQCRNQRLRDISAAVLPKAAFLRDGVHCAPMPLKLFEKVERRSHNAERRLHLPMARAFCVLPSAFCVLLRAVPLSHAPDEIAYFRMVLAPIRLHAAAHIDAVWDDAGQS